MLGRGEEFELLVVDEVVETDADADEADGGVFRAGVCFEEELGEDVSVEFWVGAFGGGLLEVGELEFDDE